MSRMRLLIRVATDLENSANLKNCLNLRGNSEKFDIFSEKPVGVLHQYLSIISQLWLTPHPTNTVVLLDTGTPVTRREITVRMPMRRLNLATPRL